MNTKTNLRVDTAVRARSNRVGSLRSLAPVLLLGVTFATLQAGEVHENAFKAKGEVKVRPTNAQLNEQRKAPQTDRKIKIADKPIEMKAIRSDKTDSLLERSAVLSHGDSWTIVPKESLLHVPKHLAERVNGQRHGKLVTWPEFLAKNRVWVQAQNVSLVQARGEGALSKEEIKAYRDLGQVIVAVCHKGPISVKPLKEAEAGKGLVKGGQATRQPGHGQPGLK